MHSSIKINQGNSYKIGLHEVIGLKNAMTEVMQPLAEALNDAESWSGDGWFHLSEAEYKSRDGFIAHSHNCGGIMIEAIIPKCGEMDFSKLEFPEYSEREIGMTDDEYDRMRDSEDGEGYNDIHLRIWLKFEGFTRQGAMQFYLVADNDCNDAPYFRHRNSTTVFETSFNAMNFDTFKAKAKTALNNLKKAVI